MFSDILGWSEQETVDWAKKYEQYLQDPEDMIYHADPPYWTTSAFVPQALNETLSPDERCRLTKELVDTFGVQLYLTDYLNVNWKPYKNQINVIVEKYAH